MEYNSLKILKAGNGDALLLRFIGDDSKFKNILIDGGNSKTEYSSFLKSEILKIVEKGECVDLLIITHTDQDHIKGIEYLLKDEEIDKKKIKKIWFNSFENSEEHNIHDISYIESCKVQKLIDSYNIERVTNIINETEEILFYGAKIHILSPNEEDINKLIIKNSEDIASTGHDYDYSIDELIDGNAKIFKSKKEELDTSIENRVSIAFLIEINNKSILFLGDASPDVIENSLKKIIEKKGEKNLKIDIIKLSHHASQKSVSMSLLTLLDTNYFIISTNGNKSNLPNKLSFAKILSRENKNEKKDYFIFNYNEVIDNLNFSETDFEKYNFSCLEPNHENGYIIINL